MFWESSWINGKAPRDIAPRLYKLAWRKKLKVKQQLENHSWTRGLWRMESAEEFVEFVRLWDLVQNVQLNDQEDQITWKLTADGKYSAKSAYDVQFMGSYCTFRPKWIWAAHAEPKHRFFAWLLLQEKILTADRLQERNWSCNPVCPLCSSAPESALHICLQCPFTQQVWALVEQWTSHFVLKPDAASSELEAWWLMSLQHVDAKQRRSKVALMLYTLWNLWKERNRRIFEGSQAQPATMLQLIKDEVLLRVKACGAPDVSFV